AADGVVSQLPSSSREVRKATRVHHDHGIPAGRRPGRDWTATRSRVQHSITAHPYELQHLPSMSEEQKQLDLAGVRARLDAARGRDYWRSLDELASTPEFRDLLDR